MGSGRRERQRWYDVTQSLIVATVGVSQGVLPPDTFSVVVGVVIITTLLTPPLLRASFRKRQPKIPVKTDTASQAVSPSEGEKS
jgi:hypothetical protein